MSRRSILFVADQPWQIRIFRTAIESLANLNSNQDYTILISDYYTFLHQKDLLRELDSKHIQYRTMSILYKNWQINAEPEFLNNQRSNLENFFGDSSLLDRLERTNQWVYGDERDSFYLKMSDSWKEKIFLDTLDWCKRIFEDTSPAMVVALERSTLPNNAIFEIAQKYSTPHMCFIPARIDNFWYLRNDFGKSINRDFTSKVLEREYSEEVTSKTELWVENFLAQKLGSYRSLEEFLTEDLPKGHLSDLGKYLIEILLLFKKTYARLFERKNIEFKIRRLEQNLVRLTYVQFRQFALKSFYNLGIWRPFSNSRGNYKYFLWALHARPEGSVLALNNGKDEIAQLVAVSKILPGDIVLIVKENIEMLGLRNRGFYQSLLANRNILLLDPKSNLADYIPDSLGVFGISGTFLLEAAIYGKPVFALGDPEFKYFLNNYFDENIEDFVSKVLTGQAKDNFVRIKKYISYIFEVGFDFGSAIFDNQATEPESKIIGEILKLVK